jgi:mannose-6-phosphate isomerase-like protein (cupin superfamily)
MTLTKVNDLVKVIGEFDANSLLHEYHQIENQLEWLTNNFQGSQCCIQTREGAEPFKDGTGSSITSIQQFHVLHEMFKGTIWETYLNQYQMYRTRFMWVNPRACYKVHKDITPRVHFVLKTNPDAKFYLPDLGADCMVHLEEGKIYWVDTTKAHSFINFGDNRRLHLVGAVDNDVQF